MINNKDIFTTDLFKGKVIPSFIKSHNIFNTPNKVKKIFKHIGLQNFSEEISIAKNYGDIKKEGSYVWNLLRDLHFYINAAKENLEDIVDSIQFLEPIEVRNASSSKISELLSLLDLLRSFCKICNPRSPSTFSSIDGIVSTTLGKIELKLTKDLIISETGKAYRRRGYSIFKLYKELREKCLEHNVVATLMPLDNIESFKVFGAENVPNKKYNLVFSSDGKDGAWDIATMSMRGFKSCQRWAGEYPRCLIGSIISKYIGIIYLTSGAPSEPVEGYESLGSKMMRRSIVRYAIDKANNTPCILLDKMYPGEDEEIIKTFASSLASKAKYTDSKTGEIKNIPIYYAPRLNNKTSNIYIPNEKILDKINHRERSYQDTAIRSAREIDAHMIFNHKLEVTKLSGRMSDYLILFLSYKIIEINNSYEDVNIKKILKTFLMSSASEQISELIVSSLLKNFCEPKYINFYNDRVFYRHFLKSFLLQRKQIAYYTKSSIKNMFETHSLSNDDVDMFCDFLIKVIVDFVKVETLKTLNSK